jgi:hypothetical protein
MFQMLFYVVETQNGRRQNTKCMSRMWKGYCAWLPEIVRGMCKGQNLLSCATQHMSETPGQTMIYLGTNNDPEAITASVCQLFIH